MGRGGRGESEPQRLPRDGGGVYLPKSSCLRRQHSSRRPTSSTGCSGGKLMGVVRWHCRQHRSTWHRKSCQTAGTRRSAPRRPPQAQPRRSLVCGLQQGQHTSWRVKPHPLTSRCPPGPRPSPGGGWRAGAAGLPESRARHTPAGAPHLHVVVLDAVVRQGLQERLGVVAQGTRVGAEAGLAGGGAAGGAAVVLVLLLVVAVVGLAGLQASREDGRLQPL